MRRRVGKPDGGVVSLLGERAGAGETQRLRQPKRSVRRAAVAEERGRSELVNLVRACVADVASAVLVLKETQQWGLMR